MIKRLWYSLLSNDKPQDKNVIWIDTSNSESFTLKLYRNGGWKPLQVVGTSRDMIERELTGYVTSHYHSYDRIINKPTTLEGYGITDCFNKKEVEKLLDNKVTKVDGMSLTSNNFSDKYKKMLDNLSTSYYDKGDIDNLFNNKQDIISDLDSIREGAKKGSTALQSFTETDPIYLKDKPFIALKSELLNDNNLVHKEGDEDIKGSKRFEHIRTTNFGIFQEDNYNHSVYIDYYYDESNYLPILHFGSEEDWLTILDNIADPVYDFHAANKHYVDEGLVTKQNILTPGNGISIEGNVIGVTSITESESQPHTSLWVNPSEDEETDVTYNRSQIDAMVGAKQDALTAGNGISIEGNVISSSVAEVVDNIVNAGYVFAGVATPATDPSTPNAKVFYIANGKGTYTNFGGVSVTEDEVVILKYDTAWHKVSTGIASQEKLTELESKTSDIKNSIQDFDGDTFYVTDTKGNIVAKIDADGVKAIEVMAQGKKLSEMPDAGDMKIASILENFYEAELFITDAQGNVIFGIDKYGIHSIDIHCDTIHRNRWFGKIMATYGDSVTAINNGNWNKPYIFDNSPSDNGISLKNWVWGNRVASYYGFNKHYGRGFGGQWWKWNTDKKKTDGTYKLGGDLCKFNTLTGVGGAVGGTDVGGGQYDYDDYLANPSIISLGQNEVACRGSLCSWNRIQTCFPVNIKDTIDLVMIINHNDTVDNGEITWVENSNVDTEWVTSGSNYYGKVNGDYNIDTLKGAIASTIMKLQMWMPQAIIVVCTPISGQGTTGQFNKTGFGLYKAVAPTKDACLKMSIPCIDVFGTDGINGMNRTSYIADGIHPYTKDGSKMIARAIIGGLKCIEPKDLFND